jgi:PAS domain S-box-containing protein
MTTRCQGGGVVEGRLHLEPMPQSARRARQLVTDVLDEAGQLELTDAATLLVSELVTNAVLHARTGMDVSVFASSQGVRVEVTDHNPLPPQRRGYSTAATTGRGLAMVDMIAERSGTETGGDGGKTVWFELGAPVAAVRRDPIAEPTVTDGGRVSIVLLRTPLRLARAWQEHADALLREYLMACWKLDGDVEERLAEHAEASEAFAELAATFDTDSRDDGHVSLVFELAPGRAARFGTLDRLLDVVAAIAERGDLLAPPTQPEIRLLRRWLCSQIAGQLSGAAPTPWVGLGLETTAAPIRTVDWDPSGVHASDLAVIAADDSNRIIAASGAVAELLGWTERELVGRRIVSIIPRRYREDHVAAFTHHLLTGRTNILDRTVEVPALHRDGTELPLELLVRREQAGEGRAVFVATLTRAG